MDNEEKKQYLKSYIKCVERENEIIAEIERLRADKMFPSLSLDGMPSVSGQSDLSQYAAILDEQIAKLKQERLDAVKIYRDIEARITRMDDAEEQRILRLRYIQGLKWEEVADTIGYSWQHTHKIHARALTNFPM